MPNRSATKAPPAPGIPLDLPCVRLLLSLHEAGLLVSALEAGAAAALDAGDARLHRELRDRAADLYETAAAKAERIIAGLGAKRPPRGRTGA